MPPFFIFEVVFEMEPPLKEYDDILIDCIVIIVIQNVVQYFPVS